MNNERFDQLAEQFFINMEKIAEERQEACIHCGKVWYVIHHKDGVCHVCQRQGKPGRAEITRRAVRKTRVISLFVIVASALALWLLNT